MKEYFNNLVMQFKLATGSKNIDVNSPQFINEFSAWIENRQRIGIDYTSFLDYMEFEFKDGDCAEVGKSEYDSVVKPFVTTLITPVTQFERVNPSRIIKGDMRVYESTPIIVTYKHNESQFKSIPSDVIRTYMTQNPFNWNLVSGWENLHNSERNNIIIGAFGSTYDKDIESKLKELELLRSKLTNGDYKAEYITLNDSYYCALGSDRKVKKLHLTKTK